MLNFLPALGGMMLGKAADHAYGAWSARYQNRFAERMASTQYQRAVADMRAAGLNPILAAGGGGAASPQSGSGFSVGSSENVMTTAAGLKRTKEETKLLKVNQHVSQTVADKNKQDTLTALQHEKVGAQTAEKIKAERDILAETLQQQKTATAKSLIDLSFYKSLVGKTIRTVGVGSRELKDVSDIATSIINSAKGTSKLPYTGQYRR